MQKLLLCLEFAEFFIFAVLKWRLLQRREIIEPFLKYYKKIIRFSNGGRPPFWIF